jgi:type IV pilus assembly protein PilV
MFVKFSNQHMQQGGTLIEVLVSIFLLSIGLLGMTGMQVSSFKNDQLTHLKAIANNSLADIADRVRANNLLPDGAGAALYSYPAAYAPIGNPSTITSPQNCLQTSCNAANLALFDLAQWRQQIAQTLPQGVGHIEVTPMATTTPTAGLNLRLTATVAWLDRSSTDLPSTCSATGNTQGALGRNCCPASLNVSSTPGIRCVRMEFLP